MEDILYQVVTETDEDTIYEENLQLKEQFFSLIKTLLQQLYHLQYSSVKVKIFSTIRLNDQNQPQFQQIPDQIISFLKQQTNVITQSNMIKISYFISSKDSIFNSKSQMRNFLTQTIRIKSFFIALLNWIIRPKTIFDVTRKDSNYKDLPISWIRNSENQQFQIKQLEHLQQIIQHSENAWKSIIQTNYSKGQLEKYSLLFNHPKQSHHSHPKNNKDYLKKIYERIFINNQIFGWKQLLKHKQIFKSISDLKYQTSTQRKTHNLLAQIRQKSKILKPSFAYLHKYFAAKDIIELKIRSKQFQNLFIKSLPFQFYLPKKWGFTLQITLDYQEWFQAFYAECNDNREQVLATASNLYKVLQKQGGKMLQMVKGFERVHLSRLMYLFSEKLLTTTEKCLVSNSRFVNRLLTWQMSTFIQTNRVYEYLIDEIGSIAEKQRRTLNETISSADRAQNLIIENFKGMDFNSLFPLMIGYVKVLQIERYESYERHSLARTSPVSEEMMNDMNRNYGIGGYKMIEDLNRIKGKVEITQNFISLLKSFNSTR